MIDDYEDPEDEEESYNKISKIYRRKYIWIKVINKEKLKALDYIFLQERLKKEQELQTLCNIDDIYIVAFEQRLETEDNIIFKLDACDGNLYNHLQNDGGLSDSPVLFAKLVGYIAKAVEIIHENGIIHRDIKPHNIYHKFIEDRGFVVFKIGNFSCATKIKENPSDSIGTILYNAPEMVKDLEYDEKVDLWSIGITLFQLYFGVLPYGRNANIHSMMNVIYEDNFVLKKTFKKNEKPKYATLDILFKRLLTINPKNRMNHEEFYEYATSLDFMKEDVICINNNKEYQKIYDDILKEEFIDYEEEIIEESISDPIKQEELNKKKLNLIVREGNFLDIMSFSNASADHGNKFNNIIYYDANINNLNYINKDSYYFERITPGAFILCTNMDSFKLIRDEILAEIIKDDRITFNLITTGSQCDNVMIFLNEEPKFKSLIKNVCVYCANIQKWGQLKKKYDIIYDVVATKKKVIDFINHFSSEKIKPYNVTKLITLNDYLDKYKDRHILISKFYGDLSPEIYKEKIEKMKLDKDQEKKEDKNKNELLESFLSFDLTKDLKTLDKLIIQEYTNNTFYGDLNKWLMNTNFNSYEVVAYFTARLMYSLNKYANKEGNYYTLDKHNLYRGMKMPYSSILPYERVKGKIIILSSFTLTFEDIEIAENYSGRKNAKSLYNLKKNFSVIFIIKNKYKNNWISNGVKIEKESKYKYEKEIKEIVFQPFSFYFVEDVKIDHKNYKADIYLETIGKQEILEEQIRIGKEIMYNEKEKIMQVK